MTVETKEAIIDWLKQQGVSTVLLFIIMAFMGYGVIVLVPSHIELIKSGYKEVAETHEKTVQKIVDSHDNDRAMFIDLLNGRTLTTR